MADHESGQRTYGLPSTVAGFWENDHAYTVTTATATRKLRRYEPIDERILG